MPPVDSKINRMILEQLKGMPDVRSELVVFLRRAIEENRYYVPEELVAERDDLLPGRQRQLAGPLLITTQASFIAARSRCCRPPPVRWRNSR